MPTLSHPIVIKKKTGLPDTESRMPYQKNNGEIQIFKCNIGLRLNKIITEQSCTFYLDILCVDDVHFM